MIERERAVVDPPRARHNIEKSVTRPTHYKKKRSYPAVKIVSSSTADSASGQAGKGVKQLGYT